LKDYVNLILELLFALEIRPMHHQFYQTLI